MTLDTRHTNIDYVCTLVPAVPAPGSVSTLTVLRVQTFGTVEHQHRMTSRRKQPLRFLLSTAILAGCSTGFSSSSHLFYHQSQIGSATQSPAHHQLLDDSANSAHALGSTANSRRSGHPRHHHAQLPVLPMIHLRASRLRLFSSRYGDNSSNDDVDDESLNDDKFLRVKLAIVKDKIKKFEKFAEEC